MSSSQKILQSGQLDFVRKDRIDQRYCVLYKDSLDYYLNADDFKNNSQKRGSVNMADVEELGVLDDGFTLVLGSGKSLTVRCGAKQMNDWLDTLISLIDAVETNESNSTNNRNGATDDMKEDRMIGKVALDIPKATMNAGTNKDAQQQDEAIEEVEICFDGDLQIEINGKRETRYFWLTKERFEYFKDQASSEDEAAIDGFRLSSIAQAERTAAGFSVSRKDKKRQMVIICDEPTSREWISEIGKAISGFYRAAVGLENLPAAKAEVSAEVLPQKTAGKMHELEEMHVEVVLDEELEIEINGKSMRKHVWLSTETFDYTETAEVAEDAIESFLISHIAAAHRTANGFTVYHDDGRTIVILCTASTSEKWTKQLQNSIESKKKPPCAKGTRDKNASVDNKTKRANIPEKVDMTTSAEMSRSAESPQRQNKINPRIVTTPLLAKQVQGTTPASNLKVDPSVVCQGSLGVFKRHQEEKEEKRYFVLYPDVFKYWPDESSYRREDEPSGHVVNEQIAGISPTTKGFALSLHTGNQMVFICEAQRQVWLTEWRKILTRRATASPVSKESKGKEQIPADNESKVILFEGSLTLVRKMKKDKRYFVLFKDRLDYFSEAIDMRSGKIPRGRIWHRDVSSVNLEGCSFTLVLADANIVLVAEKQDLQLWRSAWIESGVKWGESPTPVSKNTSRNASPSPERSNLQKASPPLLQEPLIKGAIIEGQFQISRGKVGGGIPALRHFVLFPDRLAYFSDAAEARRGRASESFAIKDIQSIDVVDGGFEMTVANRPYKFQLREMQGLLPQWIDAFLGVFGETENADLRRSRLPKTL